MVKKSKIFKPGDYVFAKVKGYPAWPAKVNELNGKKYNIYFFGTGETGNLPANDLFDYFENKQQFLAKAIKRRDYNDGLTQIEEEITSLGVNSNTEASANASMKTSQDDVADSTVEDQSGINSTIDGDKSSTANDGNKIVDGEKGNEMEVDEPTHPQTGDSISNIDDEPKNNDESTPISEPTESDELLIAEPSKTPGRGRKSAAPKTPKNIKSPKKSPKSDAILKADVPESTISRSGRKIKPKRYLDEEEEETPSAKRPKATEVIGNGDDKTNGEDQEIASDNIFARKEKKNSVENGDTVKNGNERFAFISASELQDGSHSNAEDSTAQKENVLLCVLPNGKIVGLKLYQNRPESFGSAEAQKIWESHMAKNSLKLKSQLENGEISVDTIASQIETDLNLLENEILAVKKERETEVRKDNLNFFRNENKLLDLEIRIRSALSYKDPEVALGIELLSQMAELEVRPIMLIKHPSVLEAVKRMRKYSGNLKEWNLSKEEEVEFGKKAHLLRKKAEHCYNMFKSLFTIEEGRTFLETFSDLVLRFKECTKNYAELELLEITKEPPGMYKPCALTMKAAAEELDKEEKTDETSNKTAKGKLATKTQTKDGKDAKKDKK